jgi:hypothetical protein
MRELNELRARAAQLLRESRDRLTAAALRRTEQEYGLEMRLIDRKEGLRRLADLLMQSGQYEEAAAVYREREAADEECRDWYREHRTELVERDRGVDLQTAWTLDRLDELGVALDGGNWYSSTPLAMALARRKPGLEAWLLERRRWERTMRSFAWQKAPGAAGRVGGRRPPGPRVPPRLSLARTHAGQRASMGRLGDGALGSTGHRSVFVDARAGAVGSDRET